MVCTGSGCSQRGRKAGSPEMGQEIMDIAQETGLQQHLETSLHGIMKSVQKLLRAVLSGLKI